MNELNEVWKDIEGYEGLYQVSNLGRIKSLDRLVSYSNGGIRFYKSQILKPKLEKDGYLRIGLRKEKKKVFFLIHRLVANAFIPNLDNLPQVNHKDENKQNNTVDNLEWCTAKYNINYGTRTERNTTSRINHPLRSKQVVQLDLEGNVIAIYPSLMEAQRNGYIASGIWSCCNNKVETHYGYKWQYLN